MDVKRRDTGEILITVGSEKDARKVVNMLETQDVRTGVFEPDTYEITEDTIICDTCGCRPVCERLKNDGVKIVSCKQWKYGGEKLNDK